MHLSTTNESAARLKTFKLNLKVKPKGKYSEITASEKRDDCSWLMGQHCIRREILHIVRDTETYQYKNSTDHV